MNKSPDSLIAKPERPETNMDKSAIAKYLVERVVDNYGIEKIMESIHQLDDFDIRQLYLDINELQKTIVEGISINPEGGFKITKAELKKP